MQLVRQLGERAVADRTGRAVVDEQPRRVAPLGRMLRDQLRRQLVVELGEVHPTPSSIVASVDMDAIARAQQRIEDAAAGRTDPAAFDATLERARHAVESLAATTARFEAGLPEAIQDGLRQHFRPSARHLAEVRGLTNQVIRRLERIEGDILTERHARVDDLALLVDLIASGWRSVDERLAKLEEGLTRDDAVVYRLGERQAG